MTHAQSGRLWVLVTDGHRARIVVPDDAEGPFRTLLPLGVAEDPYCAPPPRGEPAPAQYGQLAADVAGRLNEAAAEDEFDDLLLVAPIPVALEISRRLAPPAAARLFGIVNRDYAALDDATLSQRLARWWPLPWGAADPETPAAPPPGGGRP